MDPDGRDKVAVPYDEVNDVPETTFRELNQFRWWAVPNYGPPCTPLATATRERNGEELQQGVSNKFLGDGDTLVDITEDFKRERFHDIEIFHSVDSNVREISDGNRPVNKYLERTNNGGIFNGNPYTCGAFSEQAETRDRNRIGFDQ